MEQVRLFGSALGLDDATGDGDIEGKPFGTDLGSSEGTSHALDNEETVGSR